MQTFLRYTAALAFFLPASAFAEPCPNNQPCKVLTLTPAEEQTLTGPNGIFDQATWASRSTMTDIVAAWREKIKQAKAGTVETSKEQKPAETGNAKK